MAEYINDKSIKLFPKDIRENLIFRKKLLKSAKDSPSLQCHLRALCKIDILYFFNAFVFTFDPRVRMVKMPFITYGFQDEVILWDKDKFELSKDSLVEKSRDMGVTWMLVINDLHSWLFNTEKFDVLWGSRKEVYIDSRGDMKTIFEKMRYALRNLPKWLLPKDFDFQQHDNSMRLVNPETESLIVGEATNPNFSRGGRFSRIRFDEFAFWESDSAAWQAAADATNCRTALSTVNGSANKFAELAHSKIEKMTLHWSQHPKKNPGVYRLGLNNEQIPISIEDNPDAAFEIWKDCRDIVPPQGLIGGIIRSPWYDAECERRVNKKEIAEELDIDYLRSGAPYFDLRAVKAQQVWSEVFPENKLSEIPRGNFVSGNILDVGGKYAFRIERHGWCRMYEAPERGGQYVLGGDVAEGLEKGDEGFLVIRNKYTRDVCAVFNGICDPEILAVYAQKMAMFYNKAKEAIENNNHGYTVNSILQTLDGDLYWTTRKDKNGKVNKIKAGWTTSLTSRPQMLDKAREDVRLMTCEIRDEIILNQMMTFVHNKNTGKPQADGAFLDDGVFAFAIAGQVINEHPYKPPRQEVPFVVRERYQPSNAGFGFG